MYRIRDAATGALLEDTIDIRLVKQQLRVDMPIVCDDLSEADGIVYDDGTGEKMVGIAGRNMEEYGPLVLVEEISGEPYLMERMNELERQLKQAKQERQEMRDDNIALMMGVADLYTAVTTPQEGV